MSAGDVRFASVPAMAGLVRRLLSARALWPMALAVSAAILQFAISVAWGVTLDRDLTIPEGSIAYSIRAAADGRPLYRDYRQSPYATTPYPPVYYLVAAAAASVLPRDIETAYVCGRVCTLGATLVCLWLVARLAGRAGSSPTWAWGAAALALTIPCLIPWGFTCRPDFLALALTLAGLDRFLSRPTVRGAVVASAWFLAAMFTKQSFVAAPAAVVLGCAAGRSWKPAAAVLICLGVAGLALASAIDHVTGGLFAANVVDANVAPAIWIQVPILVSLHLIAAGAWVLPFGALGLSRLARRPSLAGRILGLYAAISLVQAVLMSSKAGADQNYFIEPLFAFTALSGLGMRRVEAFARRRPSRRPAVVLGLAVLCLPVVFGLLSYRLMLINEPSGDAEILRRLEAIPGDILFGDSGLAVRSGRRVLLLDKFNASYLADAGKIDFSGLVARLERGEIAAAVLDQPRPDAALWGQPWWPRAVAEVIGRRYGCRAIYSKKYVYRPDGA